MPWISCGRPGHSTFCNSAQDSPTKVRTPRAGKLARALRCPGGLDGGAKLGARAGRALDRGLALGLGGAARAALGAGLASHV